MTRDEILVKVQAIMGEMFEIEASEIQLDTHLMDDLDLDSIDAIDMAVKLQELSGRRVEEEVLKRIRTVKDVVDLVEDQLALGKSES